MFEPRTDSYNSRKDFEKNAFMLLESMRVYKIHIDRRASRLHAGLKRVRELPNQRINLLTIDESVRCLMHMMPQMDNIKENKNEEKE